MSAAAGRVPPFDRDRVLGALDGLLRAGPDPLEVLARGIRGLDGEIDAVAVDDAGTAVLVGVASADDELARLSHLLAQRSWLAPRLGDWLQLNPALPIDATRFPRLLLVGPALGEALHAAAAQLPDVALARVHALETPAGTTVGLEALSTARVPEAAGAKSTPVADAPPAAPAETVTEPYRDPAAPDAPPTPRSVFRTGLREADLDGPRRPRSAPR